MAFNHRALALLGLLDFDGRDLQVPSEPFETEERFGHWRVLHHRDVSVWKCLCGRSEPILVPSSHRNRVRLPNDLIRACEVCRHEVETAGSNTARLLAFLERHRPLLNEDRHLEYTENRGYLFSEDDGKSARTKRVIYEAFYKQLLGPKDQVSSLCRNPLCINPYHLCVRKAHNEKVTPQIRDVVHRLLALGVSAEVTKTIIEEKFGTQLCVSTVRRIRKSSTRSELILN